MMLLENLVTRRVSEENASKSSLTRRVTTQGHLLFAAQAASRFEQSRFAPSKFAFKKLPS